MAISQDGNILRSSALEMACHEIISSHGYSELLFLQSHCHSFNCLWCCQSTTFILLLGLYPIKRRCGDLQVKRHPNLILGFKKSERFCGCFSDYIGNWRYTLHWNIDFLNTPSLKNTISRLSLSAKTNLLGEWDYNLVWSGIIIPQVLAATFNRL